MHSKHAVVELDRRPSEDVIRLAARQSEHGSNGANGGGDEYHRVPLYSSVGFDGNAVPLRCVTCQPRVHFETTFAAGSSASDQRQQRFAAGVAGCGLGAGNTAGFLGRSCCWNLGHLWDSGDRWQLYAQLVFVAGSVAWKGCLTTSWVFD